MKYFILLNNNLLLLDFVEVEHIVHFLMGQLLLDTIRLLMQLMLVQLLLMQLRHFHQFITLTQLYSQGDHLSSSLFTFSYFTRAADLLTPMSIESHYLIWRKVPLQSLLNLSISFDSFK
jgi:hypothetical protein